MHKEGVTTYKKYMGIEHSVYICHRQQKLFRTTTKRPYAIGQW